MPLLWRALFYSLHLTLAAAQLRAELPVGGVISSSSLTATVLTIPTAQKLNITIALCSSISTARFFVTNTSSEAEKPGVDGGANVYEISFDRGLGDFNGPFLNGGVLAIEDAQQAKFEIGISNSGPIHELLSTPPFFGDSTSNQALLFSPAFGLIPETLPTYPNFTLPPANLSIPSPPTSSPNSTIFIAPTTPSLLALPQTACMLANEASSGTITNQSLWYRDGEGWRTQWFFSGLSPSTNYTAFVIQDSTKVSGPLFFTTKSASFACSLVHSLSYCSNVAYAVPIPPLQTLDFDAYDSTNLPESISVPLITSLTNFTTTLTTFACGRDWYSPLIGCSDCQREYRKWLCSISFPRCGEPNPNAAAPSAPSPSSTGLSAKIWPQGASVQLPLPAIVPRQNPPRNPNLPDMDSDYNVLLPCLETCHRVDRACPNFLGFRCPVKRFNAASSYAVGYIDGANGRQGAGVTGVSQDQWGNVWCSG